MTPQRSFVEPSPARTDRPTQGRRGWSLLRPFNPPITDWRGQRVWVVGASSGIGLATAEALIARGASVQVSARGAAALEQLVVRHTRTGEPPTVQAWPLDVSDASAVAATARAMLAQSPLDLVVYCAGHYREMRATEFDLAEMRQHLAINYTGALHVLDAVLPAFIARGAGHLSLISSVAGFRGLPKSLAYGPTKAALIQLAQTLHLDLHTMGIGVSVINPGFVETPLTAQNRFRMPALLTPQQAAEAILDGWARGRFEIHFPRRFTLWLKLLRLLPFGAYEKLVLRWTGL